MPDAEALDAAMDAVTHDLPVERIGIDTRGDLPSSFACGAKESCNGIDDDCDGIIDNGLPASLTCGLGIQEHTVPFCTEGHLNACKTTVFPNTQFNDGCPPNGLDDDSDGLVDQDCVPGCIWVTAENYFGAGGDGSARNPYRSLQRAIERAASNPPGNRRVCALAGSNRTDNCQETTYSVDGNTPLAIPDGVSVYGSYENTNGAPCSVPVTKIQLASNQGVLFEGQGSQGASLARFTLLRHQSNRFQPSSGTVAAVTISGSRKVLLSQLVVSDSPSGEKTIGVHVTGAAADVELVLSHIEGGLGRTAIGVSVEAGTIKVRSNCDSVNTFGNCTRACNAPYLVHGIFGRQADNSNGWQAITSFGLLVEASAAATVEANSICGTVEDHLQENTTTVALRCGAGSCAHIGKNHITGGWAKEATGLQLQDTATVVEGNEILGGCGIAKTTAVVLDGSAARLQNNRILGGICPTGQSGHFQGLVANVKAAGRFPDVHSNTIEVGQASGTCRGQGVALSPMNGVAGFAAGTFRNNIIGSGSCSTRTAFAASAGVLPITFQNNLLYSSGAGGGAVLFQAAQTVHDTLESLHGQAFAANNRSGNPVYVSFPTDLRLQMGSPCINAGLSDGAPLFDAHLVARPQGSAFDIGAFEF